VPKIVVYTSIFNNFDTIPLPAYTSDIPHICVSDSKAGYLGIYKVLHQLPIGSPRLTSRYYKVNSHLTFPYADFTIWHGGNVQLLQPPETLIDFLGTADIAAIRHQQRDCIYQEAKVCIDWKKGKRSTIEHQMARYRALGYPERNGLHTAFLIIRRNCDAMRDFNAMWWKEIKNGSVRDQLSFDYVCWEFGITPKDIPGGIYSGPFYRRNAIHKGEKK